MNSFLLVFVGGGLGSLVRYAIAHFFGTANGFPWATFMANAFSCIILGFFLGLITQGGWDERWKFLLITGFCGGFSTFSTFSNETFSLIQQGDILTALLNILLSVVVCLVCIFAGFKMSEIL